MKVDSGRSWRRDCCVLAGREGGNEEEEEVVGQHADGVTNGGLRQ